MHPSAPPAPPAPPAPHGQVCVRLHDESYDSDVFATAASSCRSCLVYAPPPRPTHPPKPFNPHPTSAPHPPSNPHPLQPLPSRLAPVQVRHDGVRARGAGGRLRAHRLLSARGQRAGRGGQITHPETHPHLHPLTLNLCLYLSLSLNLTLSLCLKLNPQLQPHPHPRAHRRPRPHQVAKFLVHNAREQAPGGDSIDNFFSQTKRVSGADDVRSPSP